jgi:hypothetical protein
VSLAPLTLISAHPWQRVAFTTYALSLSFFEAVILDALVRGGGSQALVLADVQGVRASLSEQGAQRVGKDYEVEPIAVTAGVFHPKISVLSSPDQCHVLVGSGNLTFGGWGGNWEILEHLHAGFAADALADVADFFDLMTVSDRIRQGAADHCAAIAADLRRSIQGQPRNGSIRIFHSLDASITEQVAQAVADLGGAVRLVAAAPFWDDGAAIDRLCEMVQLDEVFVHSHAHGCIEGFAGANWPRSTRANVRAVRVEVMDTREDNRRLHAKAFEIVCKRGRILVSGSANGTTAALGRNRNIEVCVARIQRERSVGWAFTQAEPLEPQTQTDDIKEDEKEKFGVLRAVLDADDMRGHVLTPKMSGAVSVYHVATLGPELLAETTLGPDGSFSISAPNLERLSWRGGRLVIRIQDVNERQAEGFVSVASFADIMRRAGAFGPRLFALLAGTETPADVAAILSWFHDDPHRLAPADPSGIRSASADANPDDPEVLIPVFALTGQHAEGFTAGTTPNTAAHRNWSRFIDQILLAFRDPRGPLGQAGTGRAGDDEEDFEAPPPPSEPQSEDPTIAKSLSFFERLFALLTKDGGSARNAIIAFDLTQYVCDRLRPEPEDAKVWLGRLIKALLNGGVPPKRRDDVAAAILTMLGMSPEQGLCRWARKCLLRLAVDFSSEPPSADGVRGFHALLPQQATFSELWVRLRELRTYPEQMRSYMQALEEGKPSCGYPDLPSQAPEEWPVLEDALTSAQSRGRILFAKGSSEACPQCHIKLPIGEIYRLRSTGVATAKNCCRKIVIWTEA